MTMVYLYLFLAFAVIGLFTFGGGYSSLPLITEIAVDYFGWITADELSNIIGIAEMTPGPFSVNCATFVGMKAGGFIGSMASTLGFVFPSLILAVLLAWLYKKNKSGTVFNSIMGGLSLCVVGIIFCTAVHMVIDIAFPGGIPAQSFISQINIPGLCIFGIALVLLLKFKVKPVYLILGSIVLTPLVYFVGGIFK